MTCSPGYRNGTFSTRRRVPGPTPAVRVITNAEREILVGAYRMTTGSGIVEALVRAKERGVDVRLIADRTTPCERESGIEPLAAAGVPVWIDAQARVAHAKAMLIDGAVTLVVR
jgi:phosphatidylserine/phosphatidylglycerophosphate/cardiolipin synthase-like enzyme